jgi:GNAT superfamily N-acetyltransferase
MKKIEEALAKEFIAVCRSAKIGQVRLAMADQAAKERMETCLAGELLAVDEAAGEDGRYRFHWTGCNDDLLSYEELAPLSLLERTFLPGALMGVMTAGERPCGIVIATEEEEIYVIEWLYVSPRFRGKGIGGELLKKMGQHSRKKGYGELAVCLSKAVESRVEGDVEAYVRGLGFTEEEKHLPEYVCRLSELMDAVLPQSERLEGNRGTGAETQPDHLEGADPETRLTLASLAEAEERTITMIRAFLEKSKNRKDPLAAERLFGQADRRLSVVAVRRGDPVGILLVHKGITGVYPYYMHSQNVKDAHALVREALWKAARCLSPEVTVIVRCIRFSSDSVMQKYSPPAACFPVRYLLAVLPK